MNPAYFIPSGIQLGTSLLAHFMRKKPPRFEETEYGKHLMELSRTGLITPELRRSLLGEVSKRTGGVAQQERSMLSGLLASRGMEKSIAGAGLLAKPGLQSMRSLAGATEGIERQNILSKLKARGELARGMTGSEEARRQEATQARTSLFQGLTQAGMQGYQGYQLGKMAGTEIEGPSGKIIKPYESFAKATAAGVRIPYGGMKYFMGEQEKPSFGLPPNFTELSERDLFELAKNAGLNYEELLALWYEERSKKMGTSLLPEGPIRRLER